MSLSYRWLILQLRPRVVHRLPGRLRIHIPALKQVDSEFRSIADTVINKLHLPAGIIKTRVNYISGNIVINYEHTITSEHHVVIWILHLKKIFENMFAHFDGMSDAKIHTVINKIQNYLNVLAETGTIIDQNFRLPDEIWD